MEKYQNEVIDPGDRALRFAHSVNINSYGNCPALRVVTHETDNFRGPVGFL